MVATKKIIKSLEGYIDGFNVKSLSEKEPKRIILSLGIGYRKMKMPEYLFGFYFQIKSIPGSAEIIINKKLNKTMRVFTAMHELCHALYQRRETAEMKPQESLFMTSKRSERLELQANIIGVLAVMPEPELKTLSRYNRITQRFLMEHYGVIGAVAKFRLKEVNKQMRRASYG